MSISEQLAVQLRSCVLEKTTAQAASVGADDPIEFGDADIFDPNLWHDPTGADPENIVVSEPGLYLINALLNIDAIAASVSEAWITVEGTTIARNTATPPAAGAAHSISVSGVALCDAGDIIILHGTNDVGGVGGYVSARITVVKIADALK